MWLLRSLLKNMRSSGLLLLSCAFLTGCATNFESRPLLPDHPASPQAEEAPRPRARRLMADDGLTRTTKEQLARKEAPKPDFPPAGMTHEMSKMEGMAPHPDGTAPPASSIYTCVMHPEVQQAGPGNCPKCGMTLVKNEGDTR